MLTEPINLTISVNWPGADLKDNAEASCGTLYQEGVKYGGEILMTTSNVTTPILCMEECGRHKGCTTWSWHMAQTCVLMMAKSSNDIVQFVYCFWLGPANCPTRSLEMTD